jgi:hypothetical protein
MNELMNKAVPFEDTLIRDNMDGTYSVKLKSLKDTAVRKFQWVKYVIVECDVCGKTCPKRTVHISKHSERTYCNLICHAYMQRHMNKRKIHKDGWRVKESYHGYVVKRIWDDRYKGEWVTKHRYVMEQHLGRKLKRTEIVHHIDMNKENNHIDNLWLCTHSEHQIAHGTFNKICAQLMNSISSYSKVEFDKDKGEYYLIEK